MSSLEFTADQRQSFTTVNQTLVVEGEGTLAGKKVVLFLAPLDNTMRNWPGDIPQGDLETLKKAYQKLFEDALSNGITHLAVPCFSTGLGKVDRALAAQAAVETAISVTGQHPELHIDFVPYDQDKVSISHYVHQLSKHILGQDTDLRHVSLHPGPIQESSAQAIVCPVREKLDFSGETAKAILAAYKQQGVEKKVNYAAEAVYKGSQTFGEGQTLCYYTEGNRTNLTDNKAEYLVNVANPRLERGGGVCGAIFDKAGPEILTLACMEATKGGTLDVGTVVLTEAGNLAKTNGTKGIIHAVGPDMRTNLADPDVMLAFTYRNALEIAKAKNAQTIAFPLISTGTYGFPKDKSISIFLSTLRTFFEENPHLKMGVQMVLYDKATFDIFVATAKVHSSRILKAAIEKMPPGQFRRGTFVTVPSVAPLKSAQVMLYAAPLASDLPRKGGLFGVLGADYTASLGEAYTSLLNEALTQGARSISIPLFSTGAGGIDPEKAAKAALAAAYKFSIEHPNALEIRFISWKADDQHQDSKSFAAFSSEYNRLRLNKDRDHISVIQGLLEQQDTDIIVVPIREGYDLEASGPTAKAVFQAIQQAQLPSEVVGLVVGRSETRARTTTREQGSEWTDDQL